MSKTVKARSAWPSRHRRRRIVRPGPWLEILAALAYGGA